MAGLYLRHAMHIAAALAGCRMALVCTGWATSHLVSTISAQMCQKYYTNEPLLAHRFTMAYLVDRKATCIPISYR